MSRHDRPRFFAFGILPLLNVLALLLYGLVLATRGRGGAAASLPLLLVVAGVVLLLVAWAAVQRGRDLGWSAWVSFAAMLASIVMAPAVLLVAGYFALAKGQPGDNQHGPPPSPPTLVTWLNAGLLLLLPWIILAVAARALA